MPDLPDVEQAWVADVSRYVAAMAELIDATKAARDEAVAAMGEIQAAIDAIHGGDINIGVDSTGAAAAAAASEDLARAADDAAGAQAREAASSESAGRAASEAAAGNEDVAHSADSAARAAYEQTAATDAAIRADYAAAAAAEARARAIADAAEQSRIDALMTEMEIENLDDYTAHDDDWISTQKVMAQAAAATAKAFALRDIEARAAADGDKALEAADEALGGSSQTASDALHGIISAMQGAATPTRIFGLSLSALHWIVGVSAEALAVLIPAIIAFGAGAAVAMQGAANVYDHMTALYGATEATNNAFHQTVGTTLHLKDALQQAQNAANPGVYELLGSAVNDTKAGMDSMATAGLSVVHMWDEFAARITVDMQQMSKSGEEQSLLGNMVSDLQELGQVFGNVGHAILNFASDMPGLAEVLLMIVDDISKVILWISQMPHWIITAAMAMEEFYRWGGLVASIIARIGLVLPMIGPALLAAPVALFGRLAGIMGSVVGVGAQLVSGLGKIAGAIAGEDVPVIGQLSGKLEGLSEDMSKAAGNTAMMGTLGLFAAAVVGAGIALDHFQGPAQQFANSVNKAVAAASDMQVIGVLAGGIVTASQKIAEQETILDRYPTAMQQFADSNAKSTATLRGMEGPLAGVANGAQNLNDKVNSFAGTIMSSIPGAEALGGVFRNMTGAGGAGQAAEQVSQLTAEQQRLIGTFHTVTGNLSYLSRTYHISGAAAETLAQEAGVNLQHALTGSSEAARIARQQIANLVTGLGAMSAPAGVVGNDMEALGIQSQLAGTKVSQLNQAWDAWISSVTGSMSDFSQVQTALQGMGSDASATSASLSGSIGSISRSASGMTYTLKGMGADAMQSWQQFTSAIGQGNTALDQLRTGMAEGVVSSGTFGSTVRGLVGEMLPFTEGNKTAVEMLSNLAHEAGGPVTTSLKQLEEWAGVKGKAAAFQFAAGMNKASQEMGHMSAVAQHLSAVVSGDLNQAMAQAILNVTKVGPLTQAYVYDLDHLGANSTTTKNALARLNAAEGEAAKLTRQAGNSAQTTAAQLHQEREAALELAKSLYGIPSHVQTDVVTNFTSTGYAGAGALGHHVGAHGGMVTGTGIIPSFAGGGSLPGFAPGVDSILAALSPGEGVLTPYALRMIGGPSALNWLNTMAEHGSTGGGGASAGAAAGGGQVAENHIHVYLDGKEIYSSVQQQNLRYGTRNAGGRTGLMVPGRKVG